MPYFTHDNVHHHYLVEGYGPLPILLLHSWTCSLHDWSFQIPTLVTQNFTTITLDTRGHGRSTVPSPSPSSPSSSTAYSITTLVSDIVALLTHLSLPSAVIMAHSTGTILASALALQHPSLVRGLILIDPAYFLTWRERENLVQGLQCVDAPERVASLFARALYTAETPAWMKAWHMRRARSTPGEAVSGVVKGVFEEGGVGVWEGMREKGAERNLVAPRLVVCTSEVHAGLERGLGVREEEGDRVVVMRDGGWPHQQNAGVFNGVLVEWLASVELAG